MHGRLVDAMHAASPIRVLDPSHWERRSTSADDPVTGAPASAEVRALHGAEEVAREHLDTGLLPSEAGAPWA